MLSRKPLFVIYMALYLLQCAPTRVSSFPVAWKATRQTYCRVGRRSRAFLSSGSRADSGDGDDGCQRTLAEGEFSSEMEVKKSRFIGYARHVKTWDDAQMYIEKVKNEHPKARHWCYGFRSGANPVNERCSDDGEPTGTAGAPILSAIRGEDLSDTVCIVVRYFGGIKLGAGGLIRSYGAAARQVLRESLVQVLIPMSRIRVKVNPTHVGSLYELVGKYSASTGDDNYMMDGSVEITVTCESDKIDDLCIGLNDATRGEAIIDRDAKANGA